MRQLVAFFVFLASLTSTPPTGTDFAAPGTGFTTGLTRWRAADGAFAAWQQAGLAVAPGGTLQLDAQAARQETDPFPPGYSRPTFYNGASFLVGEATSPVTPTRFGFSEAIPSWNVETPAGTWLEVQIRAATGDRWTTWYTLGVWAADSSSVQRHSVKQQRDQDGSLETDTLKLDGAPATAFQLKVRLFSADRARSPSLRAAAVAFSTAPARPGSLRPGDPSLWNRALAVPECSQMVYPDGGTIWCSPTSTAMVLAYWGGVGGPCEPRVRAAVSGVYDWVYQGHGNWPFNTAYAAEQGFEAYVARFSSLAQVEPWIAAGVPVIISYAWQPGELTGAPVRSTNGHLGVLIGFDPAGNPIVNDPAAAQDAYVRRTYPRAELEPLWLEHSGGLGYLIYPIDWPVPRL